MPYNNAFVPAPANPATVVNQAAPGVNYADIRAKQALAEALRKKASEAYTPQSANYTVAGNSTVPDYVGVNWGGIVQNAMQPWVEQVQEKKASTAEGEAEAARQQAIDSAVSSGKMDDPNTIMALEQLGVKGDVIKAMQPKDKTAVIAQGMASPGGRLGLLNMGIITQAQYDAAEKRYADEDAAKLKREQDNYLFEQNNKRFAPTSGTGSGDGSNLPAGVLGQMYKANLELDKQEEHLDGQLAEAPNIEAIINNPKNFGTGSQFTTALMESNIGPLRALGQAQMSPAQGELVKYFGSEVLESAGKLGGAESDRDVQMLKSFTPSMANDHETVKVMWEASKRIMARAKASLAQRRERANNPTYLGGKEQTSTPAVMDYDTVPEGVDPEDWKYMTNEEKLPWLQ